ncbi:MAG: metal-dependent hydrolase [Gammaproteobacteria bacterium]|nr:metal-dependent hydrolase [Gammaproteobacteria bacterium]
MFAINHAATALVVKKKYPQAPLWLLLISVQLMEMLWVVFNYLGLEYSSTNATVSSVLDVNLSHMPYSHSVFSTLVVAFIAWLVLSKWFHKPKIALAVILAISSHIILDLLTHTQDIALSPFQENEKLGLGLYGIPMMAFIIETLYGVLCWWIYQGSKLLLIIIVLFNLVNITFFSTALIGPEFLLANEPLLLTSIVLVQIVVTLTLIGVFSRKNSAIKPASIIIP